MAANAFEAALGAPGRVDLHQGRLEYHERGRGRPLVLLHGLVLHAGFWRKVVPELAGRHRVITPTLPLGGHRLAMKPEADLTPPGLARLVADLLTALDLEDVVLVGNDTGGAIAQIVAAQHPERLGALVLNDCDAFDNFLPWQFRHLQLLARVPGAAWQTGQILRVPALRRSPLGFGLLTKHGLADDVSASYVAPLRANGGVRRDLAKVLKGIDKRHTLQAAERLPRFDRPALVVWAREDRVFPMDHAHRLAVLLPDARVELIDDSWTYVPEDQPQALATAIAGLAGRGQPGPAGSSTKISAQ